MTKRAWNRPVLALAAAVLLTSATITSAPAMSSPGASPDEAVDRPADPPGQGASVVSDPVRNAVNKKLDPEPRTTPTQRAAPPNDNRRNATSVNTLPNKFTVQTTNATIEPWEQDGLVNEVCRQQNNWEPDEYIGSTVWYKIPTGADGWWLDTSGSDYDTVVAVWDKPPGKPFELIACLDDINYPDHRQTLLFFDQGGEGREIYFQVGGFSSRSGTLRLAFYEPCDLSSFPLDSGYEHLITGTAGNDPDLRGTTGFDMIVAKGGHDTIYADRGGIDVVCAGDGNDRVFGGGGKDFIDGSGGVDKVQGGAGPDRIVGGIGNDVIQGNADDDVLQGGPGADRLNGGLNDDRLFGGTGPDLLRGRPGNDFLDGGADRDRLYAGPGTDTCFGEVLVACELP